MADTEVLTEGVESPEAFFFSLIQDLDMASLENLFHFAEEGFAEPSSPADAAPVLPCGAAGLRRAGREPLSGWMERMLVDLKLVLQSILSHADDLQDRLVNVHLQVDGEAVVNIVQHFLKSCQPFFNKLDTVARNKAFSSSPLPSDVYIKFADVSQQLCDRLKQLLLTCASCKLLSLVDSDPLGISHFAIGQSDISGLRLTTFVYCQPAPYLSQVNTGLYKCMRWNVEIPGNQPAASEVWDGKSEELDMENLCFTEYYFLCYEDLPKPAKEANKFSLDAGGEQVRTWSIGLWRHSEPQTTTDDIISWLLCPAPSASFKKMLLLDEEPTSWYATDLLVQLLRPFGENES